MLGGIASHGSSRDTRRHKLRRDVLGVLNASGKNRRRTPFGQAQPIGHDIARQLGLVHRLGQLSLVIVPAPSSYAGKIRRRPDIAGRLDQEPHLDQIRDRGHHHHVMKDIVQAFSVQTLRRGR